MSRNKYALYYMGKKYPTVKSLIEDMETRSIECVSKLDVLKIFDEAPFYDENWHKMKEQIEKLPIIQMR